jgi:hypothetical protein
MPPRTFTTWLLAVLVVLITAGVDFYVVSSLMHIGMPTIGDVLVGTIVGAWNGSTSTALAFFFGNSANSDRKTELLATSSPGPTVQVKGNDTTAQANSPQVPPT